MRPARLAALVALLAAPLLAPPPARAATPPHATARPRTIIAALPISRMDLPWWRKRFEEKQAELHRGPVDLVFYGDSITQDWEKHGPPAAQDFAPVWQHFYGGRHAVNLGFIGDTTANLYWRVLHGEASGIDPKVAVILIGANNLGYLHWSAPDTLDGINVIIEALHKRLPHTKILLLGVLPSDRTAWASRTTITINHDLAARYAGGGPGGVVTFLDVGHVLMKNGRLDHSLFLDPLENPPRPPLHPTAQGMARIAAAMEPTLARLLGDRPRR
ncbi:MAG: hypothetical protein KGL12_12055 [Rhodospirillales bacterium]|nr:hypothetical protein [Rhodospirillales bacterium]